MGRRKKNNQIKAQERLKAALRRSKNKTKREKRGKTARQKLAEKMASK